MPKMVTVPGYDKPVEFPDSMSNADIEKVLAKQTKTFAAPKTAFQKQAASRKLGIEVEQHAATQDQEIRDAKAKAAADIALGIPVAATLAVTGGMAAPVAAGVMGASAGVAGAYREAAKVAFGASDLADSSPKKVAKDLAVDVALGTATQGAVSVGSGLLSLAGKNVLEPLAAKAAARVDAGKTILGQYGVNLMNKIRNLESAAASTVAPSADTALALGGEAAPKAAKGVQVSIDKELRTLEARIAARGTGLSAAFKERWPGMAEKLTKWDGSLSQLTEIKGDLSQMAFKKAGLNFEEQNALKEFAKGVDTKLGQKFAEIGGKELYDGFKEVQSQLYRFDVGVETANLALRHMAWRAGYMTMGAGYGGYSGYKEGGVVGAMAGAVAGAGLIAGAQATMQKGAPWLLEKLLSDKLAAPIAQKAIGQMMVGDTKGAVALFTKAASQVGADKVVKSWLQEAVGEPEKKGDSVVKPGNGDKTP